MPTGVGVGVGVFVGVGVGVGVDVGNAWEAMKVLLVDLAVSEKRAWVTL